MKKKTGSLSRLYTDFQSREIRYERFSFTSVSLSIRDIKFNLSPNQEIRKKYALFFTLRKATKFWERNLLCSKFQFLFFALIFDFQVKFLKFFCYSNVIVWVFWCTVVRLRGSYHHDISPNWISIKKALKTDFSVSQRKKKNKSLAHLWNLHMLIINERQHKSFDKQIWISSQ